MSKVLITSGCSFSECIHYDNPAFRKNWPIHLAESLKEYGYDKHISSALPSQGNGLISRGIIYNVVEALKHYDAKDILVGVMWSGANRHDFRSPDPKLLDFVINNQHNHVYENPTGFVKDAPKSWAILNVNWSDSGNKEAEIYYRMFHDKIGSSIYSIEHILRVQYFLRSKGVPYFFTDYSDHNICQPTDKLNPEISYLYEQIDKSYYLPVTSEFQWIVDNNILLDEWLPEDSWKQVLVEEANGVLYKWNRWLHPSSNQHKEFVDRIIMPFINDMYIIAK
jgi:hypothetical protein